MVRLRILLMFMCLWLLTGLGTPHASYASEYYPNGAILRSGSTIYYPDGSIAHSGSSTYYPDGSIARSGSSTYYPNGSVARSGSSVYFQDGSIALSGSTLYHQNGSIACSGSSTYYPDGSICGGPITVRESFGFGCLVLRAAPGGQRSVLLLIALSSNASLMVDVQTGHVELLR